MIALLGGTFDPVHNGHLLSALDLRRRIGPDECRLLPCAIPPQRAAPQAGAADRLAMARLASADTPLIADDREIRRGGISYTVDTLAALRGEHGMRRPLYWVVGADAYAGIGGWHRAGEILDFANVLVLARPGAPAPALPLWPARGRHPPAPCGHAWQLRLAQIDVSASAIREALAAGRRPAADALPAPVLDYIEARRLYAC